MNGWVYVWYHVNDQEPNWTPKIIKEIGNCQHSGQLETFVHGHLMVNNVN